MSLQILHQNTDKLSNLLQIQIKNSKTRTNVKLAKDTQLDKD
jgi:hypothetical protein